MSSARLHVVICKATNLRKMDAIGSSDPYVALCLKSNKKKVLKTSVKDNNLNPEWNEEFDLISENPKDDYLIVQMFDKDIASDDLMMDKIKINLLDIIESNDKPYVFDQECIKTDNKDKDKVKLSGKFRFTVDGNYISDKTRDVKIESDSSSSSEGHKESHDDHHDHKDCIFSWGSYGSTYSTSFSGYTSGTFDELSELTPESVHVHTHDAPTFKETEVKPKKTRQLSGKLVGLSNLIKADDDGTDSFVTLQLFGKSAIEKGKGKKLTTDTIHDTSDPTFNYEFEFDNVKKGDSIQVVVYQNHKVLKDVPIGECKIPVKNIEENEEKDYSYDLQRPKNFPKDKFKGDINDFGKLKIVLKYKVECEEPQD